MQDFNPQKAAQEFEEAIPSHVCLGDGCNHDPGFYMFLHEKTETFVVDSSSHRISPETVIQAMIQVIDRSFIQSKPDFLPEAVAVATGREMLRRAIEQVEPPADVSLNISDMLKSFFDEASSDD